jgi:hypothetical protein
MSPYENWWQDENIYNKYPNGYVQLHNILLLKRLPKTKEETEMSKSADMHVSASCTLSEQLRARADTWDIAFIHISLFSTSACRRPTTQRHQRIQPFAGCNGPECTNDHKGSEFYIIANWHPLNFTECSTTTKWRSVIVQSKAKRESCEIDLQTCFHMSAINSIIGHAIEKAAIERIMLTISLAKKAINIYGYIIKLRKLRNCFVRVRYVL